MFSIMYIQRVSPCNATYKNIHNKDYEHKRENIICVTFHRRYEKIHTITNPSYLARTKPLHKKIKKRGGKEK